jgi:hypothetical protein
MKKQEVIEVIEPKDIFTGEANAPVTITEFGSLLGRPATTSSVF